MLEVPGSQLIKIPALMLCVEVRQYTKRSIRVFVDQYWSHISHARDSDPKGLDTVIYVISYNGEREVLKLLGDVFFRVGV